MLDIGWSELVLIGVVALIFVGPKDLPRMFHALGRFTAKARGMAREFQRAMDDAAKSSGLDDVRKDLNGLKTGVNAVTNPSSLGINALEDAARKFEKWDPKSVLKPSGGLSPASATAAASTAASSAASSAASAAAAGTATAAPIVTVGGTEIGPETKALADKRASEAAAARLKAHELQAKAAQSASATFAARAKADAERAAAAAATAESAAPAAKPKANRAKKVQAVTEPEAGAAVAAGDKPARKPPVRRKKSDA